MPIYEYRCEQCGKQSEALQRLDEPPLTECSECGGPLRKLISAPAFQFKGTGWYVTDYARKKGSPESDGKSESSSGSDKASDKGSDKRSDTSSAGSETKSADKAAKAAGDK